MRLKVGEEKKKSGKVKYRREAKGWDVLLKAGATILHAEKKTTEGPLHDKKAYLNRDRRLRLKVGTVRSEGAREK